MSDRSQRAEVRNPVLGLPAVQRLRDLSPETRHVLAQLLLEIAGDAQHRANAAWAKHKAPMAAYWKAVAVYARHIARAITGVRHGN